MCLYCVINPLNMHVRSWHGYVHSADRQRKEKEKVWGGRICASNVASEMIPDLYVSFSDHQFFDACLSSVLVHNTF